MNLDKKLATFLSLQKRFPSILKVGKLFLRTLILLSKNKWNLCYSCPYVAKKGHNYCCYCYEDKKPNTCWECGNTCKLGDKKCSKHQINCGKCGERDVGRYHACCPCGWSTNDGFDYGHEISSKCRGSYY